MAAAACVCPCLVSINRFVSTPLSHCPFVFFSNSSRSTPYRPSICAFTFCRRPCIPLFAVIQSMAPYLSSLSLSLSLSLSHLCICALFCTTFCCCYLVLLSLSFSPLIFSYILFLAQHLSFSFFFSSLDCNRLHSCEADSSKLPGPLFLSLFLILSLLTGAVVCFC